MAKLIWMSDPHVVAEGLVQGLDPRVRLAQAVAHVNGFHADAEFCVVSGDLVDRATPADYRAACTALDRLAMPWLPMTGNHDDRALMRAHTPVPDGSMPEFVQYARAFGGSTVICLDTLTPGKDRGSFCAARRSWLADCLRENRDGPALVFLHHPPMELGLPMQDADRIDTGPALLDVLADHGGGVQLCIGHVHRPITGTVRGMAFASMRSLLYQAPPPVPSWDWDSFAPAEEPPALGVITVSDAAVRVHYEQFCTSG